MPIRSWFTLCPTLYKTVLLFSTVHLQAQTRDNPTAKTVEAESAPAEEYGPFPEGDIAQRISTENLQVGDETADRVPHKPAGNPQAEDAARTPHAVATIATTGRTGSLVGGTMGMKDEKQKALRGLVEFGESFFLDPSLRSPEPTFLWPDGASSNDPSIDPQIAVGPTVVGVLTWDSLVFYDKSGTSLPSKGSFKNGNTTEQLFANVVNFLDDHLNINFKVKPVKGCRLCLKDGEVGDARIAFDDFRQRFVVLATAKNESGATDSLTISQRRTKFLLAVSCNADPSVPCTDHPNKYFHTYGFNATPDDGACDSTSDSQPCPGTRFTPGNAADYPDLGISPTRYIMTVGVGHAPVDGGDHQPLYSYMVVVFAQNVALGLSKTGAHALWNWKQAGTGNSVHATMGVVMHDHVSDCLFPSKCVNLDLGLIANAEDGELIVTTVSGTDPVKLGSLSWELPNLNQAGTWWQKENAAWINYGNVGNMPTSAHFIDGKLTAALTDCVTWLDTQSDCAPAARLVTVDMSRYPLTSLDVDRVVGFDNIFDDPPNSVMAYGMPGAAMTRDGNIAMVYSRTGRDIFPEVRYSTFLKTEKDIRPSRMLARGTGPSASFLPGPGNIPNPKNFIKPQHLDTAGVALDPFDHQKSVWICHFAATRTTDTQTHHWRVAVGKVFGSGHPDLVVPGPVSFFPVSARPGDTISVQFSVHNGGDGEADGNYEIFAEHEGHSVLLGKHEYKKLQPGENKDMALVDKLPEDIALGKYRIWVDGTVTSGVQYRTDNDSAEAGKLLDVLPKFTTGGGPPGQH